MEKIIKKFNLTEEDIKLNRVIKIGDAKEAQNILKNRFKDYEGFHW